jgi:hypothetical protein
MVTDWKILHAFERGFFEGRWPILVTSLFLQFFVWVSAGLLFADFTDSGKDSAVYVLNKINSNRLIRLKRSHSH